MTIKCKQIRRMSVGDTNGDCAVDFTDLLTTDEALTGTPSVTCTGLTITNIGVNEAELEAKTPDDDTATVAVGKAVQFTVEEPEAGRYEILVECATDVSPKITRIAILQVV